MRSALEVELNVKTIKIRAQHRVPDAMKRAQPVLPVMLKTELKCPVCFCFLGKEIIQPTCIANAVANVLCSASHLKMSNGAKLVPLRPTHWM